MSKQSVAKIVKKWPSVPGLARELSAHMGKYVSQGTVRSWYTTYGVIRSSYWDALIALAKQRGIQGVTLESLHEANK